MRRKIYTYNSEFNLVTGIQKVIMDIHEAITEEYDSKLVGQFSYEKLNINLGIKKEYYIQKKNWFMFRNSIVILHQRKFLPIFWILNHVFLQRITLVYVHHSILKGRKLLSLYPKHIITISDKCIENLTAYFNVPAENITKIRNCVRDCYRKKHEYAKDGVIKILYAAKIYPLKRQIEMYKNLKGKIPINIQIIFAGDGPDFKELKLLTKDDKQFKCLGFVKDVRYLLNEVDYSLLYSDYEGLSISLIEATMMAKPIICNNVGGNCEIAHEGENAFIANTYEMLVSVFNKISNLPTDEYYRMSKMSRCIYNNNFTFETFKEKYLKYLCTL